MSTPLSVRKNVEIPPELLRSTPRSVSLSAPGIVAWVFIVLLGVGGTLGPALLGAASARWSALKSEMRNAGVIVPGTVVALRKSGGDHPERIVSYAYTVDGREYQNQMRLSLRRTANWRIGSPVDVRYLPRDPRIGWLNGREPAGVPIFLAPITAMVCLLILTILIWNLRRQRELLTWGRPAIATVTRVQKAHKGEHRVIRIEYEFHVLSGAVRTGKSDVQRNPPELGSSIVILYDRDNDSRQLRYPLSLYRLEGAAPSAVRSTRSLSASRSRSMVARSDPNFRSSFVT